MADRITDQQVLDLDSILKSDASIDAKVHNVSIIKSGIKQHNVPDTCVFPLFEALRAASSSQHAVLVNAGFTALNHLLTRLSRQEPKYLVKEAPRVLPVVIDKMGDQKEKFRSTATQALITLFGAAPVDVERSVRNTAMAGKNPRAKEAAMHWLLIMHQEHALPFKGYVPALMDLLEDADGMVRDTAKTTVIELFKKAPNTAKADLKRQLKNFKVRPAIEQAIVKELVPTSSSVPSSEPDSSQDSQPAHHPARPNLAASVSSLSSERPVTPALDSRPEKVEPLYVNTQREIDEMVRDMHYQFEGRETEQNWIKREEGIIKLRRLLSGNASSDHREPFLAALVGLLDGIIKAVTSLRTSLSKEGCSLVQEIAMDYGPGMDPMVEILMQTLIKLSAGTKKISSQQANSTVDIIIGKVTYSTRLMQHVWGACQDKNVQPRMFATGWLKTILNKESHHKDRVERTGGLDMIEKCIKKGLHDSNPAVRERMRSTYWSFARIWPAKAETLMDDLDPTAQKLLRNDPNNPNASPRRQESGPAARPGLGLSKSTMGTSSKPTLRETMLAQKKAALAAKNLPARPGSAMSHFSPVRTVSNSSMASSSSTAAAPSQRPRPEPALRTGHGGLSVAPMRPTRKRPELAARPATAGPYSGRNRDHIHGDASSPPDTTRSKVKAVTPKTLDSSPKRTVPRSRSRPGHTKNASESSIATPSRTGASRSAPSQKNTPAKLKHSMTDVTSSSPSRAHEDFTLVVPNMPALKDAVPKETTTPKQKPVLLEPDVHSPTRSLKVYEDPFTEERETPKPTVTGPVLEDKPVNENTASIAKSPNQDTDGASALSPDKVKQNSRLLDSGISRIKAKSLDVHGFRKLQGIIRENKVSFTDDRFNALVDGMFEYLEAPLSNQAPEKVQDVKAQILATIKLLLKKERDLFQPRVSRGLEALLTTRAEYDTRAHIVAGLEILAEELVTLGDASEIALVLTRSLQAREMDTEGCRCLTMGLHVLKELLDARPSYMPSEKELASLSSLSSKCLNSSDSGVRMDAVQLSVAVHARLGDARFWEEMKGLKDDPKSLITYYIVKRQREQGVAAA